MMTGVVKRKNILFLVYYSIIIFLIAFPGAFDWANRIDPWIMGLPFSFFYLFLLVGLLSLGTICQYLVENKLGELDIEIEPLDKNMSLDQHLGTNNAAGGEKL